MNKKIVGKLVEKAKNDRKILAVFLFGSFLRDKHPEDIDICLVLRKNVKKSEFSKIKLKYLSDFHDLDISIFQQLPIYIRKRVIKEGKILLMKDFDELYDIVIDTIKEFDDFKKIYKMYLEGVMNG
ncbi:MAG: nucleotidyltransferase domain-containing protein [Candidatus Aenigmarchaeota archaeon]|nr:nucleotidyltransferase domain-containing protein [Candidatus Aenigmarchaeota archaeon]